MDAIMHWLSYDNIVPSAVVVVVVVVVVANLADRSLRISHTYKSRWAPRGS